MTSIRLDRSDWDDVRDGTFFRLMAQVFSPDFCAGASALLGSYDDEPVPATTAARTAPDEPRPVLAGLAVPRRRGA